MRSIRIFTVPHDRWFTGVTNQRNSRGYDWLADRATLETPPDEIGADAQVIAVEIHAALRAGPSSENPGHKPVRCAASQASTRELRTWRSSEMKRRRAWRRPT